MKIDVTANIVSLEDIPVDREKVTPDGTRQFVPMTLGFVCVEALMASAHDEQTATGEDKFKRYQLAQRIALAEKKARPASLSVDEVALVKARIGRIWSAMVVGAAWELLELCASAEQQGVTED